MPFGEVKAEISSIESVEFEPEDFKPDVKPYEIPFDPGQRDEPLQARLAALAIVVFLISQRRRARGCRPVLVFRAVGAEMPAPQSHLRRGLRPSGPTQA